MRIRRHWLALRPCWPGKRAGLPVVYECRAFWEDAAVDHGTTREGSARYRLTRWMESWVFRRVGHVVCICDGLRREIVGRGIPAERVGIVPNGVQRLDDCESVKQSGRIRIEKDEGPVLGFLGSFYRYEGLDLAVRAVAALRGGAPGIRLLLVGGGPEETSLRMLTSELGLGEHVVFTGRVAKSEIPNYYSKIDIALFPRRSMRLTELVTPLKPLEAMERGCLVVASDVGGHRELIEKGVTGELFEPDSVSAICNAVTALIAEPDKQAALRAAAHRFVVEDRGWPELVKRYPAIYASAVADQASQRARSGGHGK